MKLRHFLTALMFFISISIFALQPKNVNTQSQEEQPKVEKLQKEHEEMQQQLRKLEKDIMDCQEYNNKRESMVNSNLNIWFVLLTIVMTLLGVGLGVIAPYFLNNRSENNMQRQLDEATRQANMANQRANIATREAEEAASQALNASNQTAQALDALKTVENLKEDINIIKKSIEKSRKDAERSAKRSLASEFYNQALALSKDNPLEAIKWYTKAISVQHDYYEAYNNRGNLKKYIGDNEGAMEDFNKAIESNPQDPKRYKVYISRGDLKLDLGDIDGALLDYSHAIELNPNDGIAYNNKADLLLFMGKYGQALDEINHAIENDSEQYIYYVTRGEIYMAMEKYEKSITDFTEALRLNDQFKEGYLKRAECYRELFETEPDVSKKAEYLRKAKADEKIAYSMVSSVKEVIKRVSFATDKNIVHLKRNVYRSDDKKLGFVFCQSKAYKQGKRQKYWFGYRKSPLELIKDCEEQYMIYFCRDSKDVLLVPVMEMESHLSQLSRSTDDKGDTIHWHIVLFRDKEGHFTQLLPKSETVEKEINMDEYIIK